MANNSIKISELPVANTTTLEDRVVILSYVNSGSPTLETIPIPKIGAISGSMTYSTLPVSPLIGQRAFITDCNTAIFLANAAGGGTNLVPVLYNGLTWVVA